MKKGDKIWAIKPFWYYSAAVTTVGNYYIVTVYELGRSMFVCDNGTLIDIHQFEFDEYFSLTPPESTDTYSRKSDFIEKASIAAMQGLISHNHENISGNNGLPATVVLAETAIEYATELWSQLNNIK